jgi:hypothetical protein
MAPVSGTPERTEELLFLATPVRLYVPALPHSTKEFADKDAERHHEDHSEHDFILGQALGPGYGRTASVAP